MDLNKIRNMNDEELTEFLKKMTRRTKDSCTICGEAGNKIIKIENPKTFQTKKLCNLCENHYQKMLKYLEVFDIDWNE